MNIVMTDETGRVIAQGSGEQLVKSLAGATQPKRSLTPMRPINIESGYAPVPLAKSFSSKAEQIDAVILAAQQKFGRFQVLRRLEELGLV